MCLIKEWESVVVWICYTLPSKLVLGFGESILRSSGKDIFPFWFQSTFGEVKSRFACISRFKENHFVFHLFDILYLLFEILW